MRFLAFALLLVGVCLPVHPQTPPSVDHGVKPPVLIHKVAPEYSKSARDAGIEGRVVISMVVDESGVPRNLKIVSGSEASLDTNALEAVKKWRFQPGTKDDKPVAVVATAEVNFRFLENAKGPSTSEVAVSGVAQIQEQTIPSETSAHADQISPTPSRFSLRWEPGCPGCARFVQKGIVLKAVQNEDVSVYASLTDTGSNLYAYVIVRNRSVTKMFDLFPDRVRIEVLQPNRFFLSSVAPRDVITRARRSASRRAAWASVESLQAVILRPVYGVKGSYGTAWVYTYDTGAIERARQRVDGIVQAHLTYEEQLKAFLLYGESVLPNAEVSGAVYFERKKNLLKTVLTIELEPANLPIASVCPPLTAEIPFSGDEIGRP